VATDGRDAAAGDARDLGEWQPFKVAQHDRDPLGRWQRGHGVGDRVDGQIPLRLLARAVARVAHVAQQVEGFGDPPAGDPVQRAAGDYPVQPGGEAGVGLEPGQLLPRGDERFLGDVFGA
jgi:hypothetical protein